MKRLLAYAAIYIFWGASFLAIREVVVAVPPFFSAGIRFFLAGLVLLAFSGVRRMGLPRGREWRSVTVLALLLFVVCYGLLFWAEQKLASGLAAVIAATIPAWVFALEWLWLRRVRLTPLTGAGLLMGLGGVTALVLPPGFLSSGFRLDRHAALLLAGTVCWALGTILATRLRLPRSPVVSSGWQMTIGGIGLLLFSGALGEWRHATWSAWHATTVLSMLYLVVFASVLAFSAYLYLLSVEPAARVASYAYVNPVIALVIGTSFAGEILTNRQAIASAVVILGVLATLFGKGAARLPAEPETLR